MADDMTQMLRQCYLNVKYRRGQIIARKNCQYNLNCLLKGLEVETKNFASIEELQNINFISFLQTFTKNTINKFGDFND